MVDRRDAAGWTASGGPLPQTRFVFKSARAPADAAVRDQTRSTAPTRGSRMADEVYYCSSTSTPTRIQL